MFSFEGHSLGVLLHDLSRKGCLSQSKSQVWLSPTCYYFENVEQNETLPKRISKMKMKMKLAKMLWCYNMSTVHCVLSTMYYVDCIRSVLGRQIFVGRCKAKKLMSTKFRVANP